jgi:fatty acid desaturase
MGLIAIHELQHRTVFKTRALNEVFEIAYAFISWSDHSWYQQSQARHHRVTCHRQYDGEIVLPAENATLRLRHRNWARILLIGHSLIALIFIISGHWFLVVVFTFGTQYCSWLGFLTGLPQHIGMNSNEPDFRMSTRTYTCSRLIGFYYWNMQHHVEHHMYPAVPFYQLPQLRRAIEHDLPVAPDGLIETWREILSIRDRMKADPNYRFIPDIKGKFQA